MHIIKYPLSQGELPQLEPIVEYHLVSPRGTLSATFEDRELALKRWREGSKDFKLVEVTRRFREITPEQQQTTSGSVVEIGHKLNIPAAS